MKNKTTITAIITIGALQAIALIKGIDGQLFIATTNLIACLAGYQIGIIKGTSNKK